MAWGSNALTFAWMYVCIQDHWVKPQSVWNMYTYRAIKKRNIAMQVLRTIAIEFYYMGHISHTNKST